MNKQKYIPDNDKERDPFLEEAMEGWKQFPKARMSWFKTKARFSLFLFGKSWSWLPVGTKWMIGSIAAASTVTVITVSTVLFRNEPDQMFQQQAINENTKQLTEQIDATEEGEAEADNDDIIVVADEDEETGDKKSPEQKDYNSHKSASEEVTSNSRNTNTAVTTGTSNLDNFYSCKEAVDSDETVAMDKLDTKKAERLSTPSSDRLVAALPWLWVHDFKIVDYDMLRTDMGDQPVAVNQSLSPKYSSNTEREKSVMDDEVVTIDTIPYKQYLASTLLMIKQQNYTEAERQLKVLANKYPKDENVIFYTGFMYYEQGSFSLAIPYFEKAMKSPLMAYATDAEWFIANSLLSMGKTDEACAIFRLIESRNNFYSRDARKQLKLHDHE